MQRHSYKLPFLAFGIARGRAQLSAVQKAVKSAGPPAESRLDQLRKYSAIHAGGIQKSASVTPTTPAKAVNGAYRPTKPSKAASKTSAATGKGKDLGALLRNRLKAGVVKMAMGGDIVKADKK